MNKYLKTGICIGLISLMLTGCGNPKLKDGSELLLEMDGSKLSVEDFYQELKDTYGTYVVINEIDKLLLNKVYETTDAMQEKIDAQVTSLKNQFGSDFAQAINYYYGVNTQKELADYIEMTIKKELATNEYAQTLIDDKDIEKYYDEKAIGDIKASHILIKSEATDDMTDEEKAAAEAKALATAKDIIKKLNAGEKFADLAKKYSGDSSASDGGNLGYFNRGDMVTEFEDAAVALKVNEYTKTPVKTKYGYHIILKTDQKAKPALKDIKEDIRTTLVESLIANTSNITTYAMEWIREKNGLKIYDSELKIKYDHYMNEQKQKESSTTNS
jgi:foldase protein PrsA